MDLASTAGLTAQPYAPWPNNLVVRIGNICHWFCGSLPVKAMCPFPPQIPAEGRFENRTAMYLHAFASVNQTGRRTEKPSAGSDGTAGKCLVEGRENKPEKGRKNFPAVSRKFLYGRKKISLR